MSHYKPYPAYRDSGVEWIGCVPEHWSIVPLKLLAQVINGATPESGTPAYWDGDVTWFTPADLNNENATELVEPRRRITAAGLASCAARLTPAGSIVLSTRAPVGSVGVTLTPSATNQGCRTLVPVTGVPPKFLAETLVAARSELALRSNGTTFQELSTDSLSSLRLPLPPPAEQAAIAAAIDRETARIDMLIAKKTRFIELLKEKRKALITHAVTKGLDPAVKMKDSGVEWVGEVPEHWEISKLAYTTREAGGKTPDTKNQAYWDGNVPWVSPKDMKQAEIVDSIDKISDAAVSDCGMKLFAPGTILAVVRGMILAHSFPVAGLKVPATINQDIKALEPDRRIRPNYLRLILETAKDYVVSVLVAEAAHGTRVLRTDVWRQLRTLLPPVEEQDLILAELDQGTTTYDKLIQKVEHSIALLKERRSALITAAVTGQIDLRGEASAHTGTSA